MTRGCEHPLSEVSSCSMFSAGSGGAGSSAAGGAGGGGYGDCGEGYGLGVSGYVPGGGRLQQYAAHFAPHQNVWHHHHAAHHDSYGTLYILV